MRTHNLFFTCKALFYIIATKVLYPHLFMHTCMTYNLFYIHQYVTCVHTKKISCFFSFSLIRYPTYLMLLLSLYVLLVRKSDCLITLSFKFFIERVSIFYIERVILFTYVFIIFLYSLLYLYIFIYLRFFPLSYNCLNIYLVSLLEKTLVV